MTADPVSTPIRERLRPADVPPDRLLACIGLVSDTHFPERLAALPPAVFQVFHGVDLVLHAGDIGLLRVIDDLSAGLRGVPVVAVHGNDERFPEAQRELPYQQMVGIGGHRLVLSHTHHPDLAKEMESRKNDAWAPKLDRRAAFGHSAGAKIVVYGHTHIPTDVEHQGVRLINPGALASGNFTTRQFKKTVALLYLRDDGAPFTVHVDVAQPDRPWRPEIDWDAGFRVAFTQTQESILRPEAEEPWRRMRDRARALGPETFEALRDAMLAVCHRAWSGALDYLGVEDIREGLEAAQVPEEAKAALRAELA